MIVKVKSHKKPSFQKLLEYMLNDKDRLFDKDGKSFVITHNLKGNDIGKWVEQFQTNENYRQHKRKNSIYLTHEILSWHKDDVKHISLEKMENMGREYLRQRNPKGIYLAVPHFDKEHYHIHICASAIEYKTGKTMRMSKGDFQNLKKNIQNYQREKFPELSHSIVGHGNEKKAVAPSDKEYQYKQRTGRASNKEQIIGMLKTCYKKANSKEDFFELVKECGIKTYERGGRISGLVFQNRKFRLKRLGFTDERLEKLDVGMKRGRELERLRDVKEKNINHIR